MRHDTGEVCESKDTKTRRHEDTKPRHFRVEENALQIHPFPQKWIKMVQIYSAGKQHSRSSRDLRVVPLEHHPCIKDLGCSAGHAACKTNGFPIENDGDSSTFRKTHVTWPI